MISMPSRRRRFSAAVIALAAATAVPSLAQSPATADDTSLVAPATTTTTGGEAKTLPGSIGDPVAGLLDLDVRGRTVPSLLQKRSAARLDAVDLRWNRFGTPASVLPADGVLARATSKDPVTAARSYLVDNAAVFGLSAQQMRDLELVNDQKLVYGGGHAVLFRQKFGSLTPALASMVTVGVNRGEIAYVSSSLTKGTALPPKATINPLQGWILAAENVGLNVPLTAAARISAKVSKGFTRLRVPGLAQEQQARLRALAMGDGSVRPVIEANVIDVQGGNASAYTLMVDAVTGKVLYRENKVENQNDAFPFTGSVTAVACGPKHAFEITDDATKTITVLATTVNAVNDITLNLYGPGGAVIASQDLLTSPEVLTYSNANIPAGGYAIEVCPFQDPTAPFLPPGNYVLGVTLSNSESGVDVPEHKPKWRFFPANPSLDSPSQTPTNSEVGCWFTNTRGCTLSTGPMRNVQAIGPWDVLTTTGLSTMTTVGNNANTHEAWASPLTPGGLAQAPISPTGQYTTKFTDAWNNSECNPSELRPGGNDINFSVGNLFVTHNRMHDFSYYLGFNERNYNMQLDNLGRGGVDGDFEIGNAQAGALTGGQPSFLGRDNANQITLQDGVPGITNQYLFQPIAGAFYAPCTDGGLDMGIVGHEYTHAISGRMVGGPDEGLTSEQGGAMGESWSDLVAAEFQFEHGYKTGGNVWAVGLYATGNKTVAIRDYAINRNPLNYSNYGFDSTGPEVHADGEIWNGVNWEVRSALVKKWNKKFPYAKKALQLKCGQAGANKGVVRPQKCPGNRRWLQLMFDAFLLQQGATSMLDARDAFIAADQMRFRGENRDILWAAFARRGMGKGAATKDGEDTNPKPSFRSALGKNTKVTFKTKSPGTLYVGDFEARVAPIADTVKKTKMGATASFTPGTYDMLYVGPKHGFMRFTMKVSGKKKQVVRVKTTKNLAAKKSGAKIIDSTPGGRNPDQLIDGTENFSWAGVTDDNVDASQPSISVDLAGRTSTIKTVAVSAYLRPAYDGDADAGSRFTALRKFAIEACTSACTTSKAKWKRVFTSKDDAFPSVRPRPVAPTLNMRAFAIKPTKAAALRLVVLENQCTGFAGYAGELDKDPINDTDCKTGSTRGTIVHVAELQAFSSSFPSWKSSFGIDNPQRSS